MLSCKLSNFEFLKNDKKFELFTEACMEAEKGMGVSPAATAMMNRRALELAVKWVYTNDSYLTVPYTDTISSLIHNVQFKDILDNSKFFNKLKYIISLGNLAVHTSKRVARDEAITSLRNLFEFVSWINYCYGDEYEEIKFDENLIYDIEKEKPRQKEAKDLYEKLSLKDKKLEEMIKENEDLRKELRQKREESTRTRGTFKLEENEKETREKYINLELKMAGWEFNKDLMEEVPVTGMPSTPTGKGNVDYVMYGDDGKPLAVLEVKRTSKDPRIGKEQARLYADCLEKKHGQRPVIFYSNGLEYHIWDDLNYSQRTISGIYTKEELKLLISRRMSRKELVNVKIDDNITNRPYQKEAILNVCDGLSNRERKFLLVMATGSGKTRVAISIVDVLTRHNWIKNILFLADRTALVKQAKANFNKLMPHLSLCNLTDNKDNPESRMVFSTYPTMMNAIDTTKSKNGDKLFTVGHFDLIIIDESHRSIYKKYQAIFDYFDSYLLGLTATPRDDIDKNTYSIFDLEDKVPTFPYELDEAVNQGYLVDYKTVETELKIVSHGIVYDDLSEEEKETYEDTFDDDETIGTEISSEEINKRIYNDDTIDKVIHHFMEKGIKVEGGDKLGKTIIFAKNHKHAVRIVERFDILYPKYAGSFAKVIDNQVKYHQNLIDEFSIKEKMPQIAVSVDMLDTGIDIPEVVNLVFFKTVKSKSKFWQMIGRGTRLCKDLFGVGQDKEYFRIFDYCSNFEFFRENPKGVEVRLEKSLTEKLFNVKTDIIRGLQHIDYQTDEYISLRNSLIDELTNSINELDINNFKVRQHLKYVDKYKNKDEWKSLDSKDVTNLKNHVSNLISSIPENELAKRFDHLMYSLQICEISDRSVARFRSSVLKTVEELSKKGTTPQVMEKKDLLDIVKTDEFWESATVLDYEYIRKELRNLIILIDREERSIYFTNFEDEFLNSVEKGSEFVSNDFKDYRKKADAYLKPRKDNTVIYKLRNNKKLTTPELNELENILWNELGTKEDYKKEYGDKPLVRMVREIVGMDIVAVEQIFSEFLNDKTLDANQIRFIREIINYVSRNGHIEKKVLQEDPFTSVGSIIDIFSKRMDVVGKIIEKIDEINSGEGA